jgi:hypothetical protein
VVRGSVDGHDLGPLQERAGHVVGDLHRRQLGVVRVDQPHLGEGDQAGPHPEQLEDAEVLLGLRLPALGGGDDEEAGVHRTHPGEHVADEADVAGDVDEREATPRRQRGPGEAEVDRQAARLLPSKPSGSIPDRVRTSVDLPWST